MFSNVDEFGDEMLNGKGSIDHRNNENVLGEHERPTFRDVAIATCAYREAVKRVRQVTFPDSALTTTTLSTQSHSERDATDTVAPQTTTTALDGTVHEPIIRPSGTPFQTGWTTTSARGRNENVSFWSSLGGGGGGDVGSSASSSSSTPPTLRSRNFQSPKPRDSTSPSPIPSSPNSPYSPKMARYSLDRALDSPFSRKP